MANRFFPEFYFIDPIYSKKYYCEWDMKGGEKQKDMHGLIKLTKQQEKSLHADDQALLRMGLISSDLAPTDEGFKYQRRIAFEKNRKEIAAEAAKEIAAMEAEAAAQKAVK